MKVRATICLVFAVVCGESSRAAPAPLKIATWNLVLVVRKA